MEKISVSDLSIGDWVCAEQLCGVHNEPRLTPPMKVVGLGESWVNLEIDPEQGDPFEFEPSEIRGVPITLEILEKNGVALAEDYDECIALYTCPAFSVVKYGNSYTFEVPQARVRVEHVHELQHAIRLARIKKEITL